MRAMTIRIGLALMLALLGVSLCGCKSGSTSKPAAGRDAAPLGTIDAGAAIDAIDATATATLPLTIDPDRTYPRVPLAAGVIRYEAYDVELDAEGCKPGVRHPQPLPGLSPGIGPRVVVFARTVGTMRLVCGGAATDRACIEAACATLRAVPGGTTDDAFPLEDPVASIASPGGFADANYAGVDVFSDGSVQYHGPHCPRWRGRRGMLTPAARDALFAALTASGIETMTESSRDEMIRLSKCADDGHTAIIWKGKTRFLGCSAAPAIEAAVGAFSDALLPNPCD